MVWTPRRSTWYSIWEYVRCNSIGAGARCPCFQRAGAGKSKFKLVFQDFQVGWMVVRQSLLPIDVMAALLESCQQSRRILFLTAHMDPPGALSPILAYLDVCIVMDHFLLPHRAPTASQSCETPSPWIMGKCAQFRLWRRLHENLAGPNCRDSTGKIVANRLTTPQVRKATGTCNSATWSAV